MSYVHGFNTFALAGNEFSIPCKFSEFEKAGFTISNDEEKRLSRENLMVMHTMRRMELTAGRSLFLIHQIRILCRKRESLEDLH